MSHAFLYAPFNDRWEDPIRFNSIWQGCCPFDLRHIYYSESLETEREKELQRVFFAIASEMKKNPELHLLTDARWGDGVLNKEKPEDSFCQQVISYWQAQNGEVIKHTFLGDHVMTSSYLPPTTCAYTKKGAE
jgi:hypothetical protein